MMPGEFATLRFTCLCVVLKPDSIGFPTCFNPLNPSEAFLSLYLNQSAALLLQLAAAGGYIMQSLRPVVGQESKTKMKNKKMKNLTLTDR